MSFSIMEIFAFFVGAFLIYLIFAGNAPKGVETDSEGVKTKLCPSCNERVQYSASVCKHCRSSIGGFQVGGCGGCGCLVVCILFPPLLPVGILVTLLYLAFGRK